jgi:hypothetical protein
VVIRRGAAKGGLHAVLLRLGFLWFLPLKVRLLE